MKLLDRSQVKSQQPRFLWSNPSYYQITKDHSAICFYFDRFPNKMAIVMRIIALFALMALLAALLVKRFHAPWYSITVPLAVIVIALVVRLYIWQRHFGGAKIQITSNTCMISSCVGSFEVHPLLSVLLHIRTRTRDGYGIGEMGDRELFLVTESSEGQQLCFPLAVQGTADKLAKDLAMAAHCPLEEEYID